MFHIPRHKSSLCRSFLTCESRSCWTWDTLKRAIPTTPLGPFLSACPQIHADTLLRDLNSCRKGFTDITDSVVNSSTKSRRATQETGPQNTIKWKNRKTKTIKIILSIHQSTLFCKLCIHSVTYMSHNGIMPRFDFSLLPFFSSSLTSFSPSFPPFFCEIIKAIALKRI